MKKLPIDEQSFEKMREKGRLYIDKTRHIHRMTDQGTFYFLSRPRRFGKSLLVSTLKNLFQGNKSLFTGLWIAEHGNWKWAEHPVIIIDFNTVSHDTPENMRTGLDILVAKTADNYGIDLDASLLKERFSELILGLHKKTEMPVVILIDEYDKPIIDHLGKGSAALEIAKANRDIFKNFLGVLKGGDVAAALGFVFITGVSKFSRASVFSDLNHLIDITMSEPYADMLGYTQNEIETCFNEYIMKFAEKNRLTKTQALEKFRLQYNGYRFSERDITVYNPFSVLRSFFDLKLKNYWFESGTPTFLVNLLKEKQYNMANIENMEVDEEIFSTYELENLCPEALLFQTGYLTIKDVDDELYTLSYPNNEVKNSFLKHLLFSFSREMEGSERSKFKRLSKYLKQEKFDDFFETITSVFGSIPYTLNTQRDEAYFHTIFYLMVSASGADAKSEILTSRGRIDLVVEFHDKIFIIEFKCDQSADKAIKQIQDKGYAERYKQTGKKLFLIGINFSSEKRNIAQWNKVDG